MSYLVVVTTPQPHAEGAGERKKLHPAMLAALWAVSNGRCYAPGCPMPVVLEVRPGVYRKNAQVAHIYGVKPGAARYHPNMPADERDSFANLLLLCLGHHEEVDGDEQRYPPELLKQWKAEHEGADNSVLSGLIVLDTDALMKQLTEIATPPLERLEAVTNRLEETGTASAETVAELKQIITAMTASRVSYWRSVKVRREEQARLVYSKVTHLTHHEAGTEFEPLPNGARIGNPRGPETGTALVMHPGEKSRWLTLMPVIQLTAAIHNGSKELIGPVKVQVVNIGRKTTYDTFSVVVDAVDPESDYLVDFVLPNVDHPGEPSLGTTLLFRDASGRWWRRHLAEPIEAVHDDPENPAWTSAERVIWAANARAMGIEPSPEPKVPLRAQGHRLWRKLRGKSPMP